MFKRFKASPATRGANAAGSSASEKKEKKKKFGSQKLLSMFGYAASVVFILTAVFQTTGAFSNINAASIIYNMRLAQMRAEEEKAKEALENELNISINDDGTISADDTSDSNPINVDKDGNYYMDDDDSIIYVDKDGDTTVYHICTTCSKCGHVTECGDKCGYCGSDFYRYTVYQVQKGDTLSEISGKVGASVNSIAHLNEIENVNLIYAGESLRIPD